MSAQKNKAEYCMALVVLGSALFLSVYIWVMAAFDGEYALMFFTSITTFIFAVLFQKSYRKLVEVERGELRGKDDEDQGDEDDY